MELTLPSGTTVLIDEADYPRVSARKWHTYICQGKLYVRSQLSRGRYVKLHRFILDAKPGEIVDHINGNRQDNRRSNLRIVTKQQSNMNRGPKANSSSRYKGVYFHNRDRKWAAHIFVNRKCISLGYYDDEDEAAIAYDVAAQEYHGRFARLNFPPAHGTTDYAPRP